MESLQSTLYYHGIFGRVTERCSGSPAARRWRSSAQDAVVSPNFRELQLAIETSKRPVEGRFQKGALNQDIMLTTTNKHPEVMSCV